MSHTLHLVRDLVIAYTLVAVTYMYMGIVFYTSYPMAKSCIEDCTYQDMSCRIAHAGQLSESFEVKTGVRQGCLLSPFLFLLVIDWIMKTTTGRQEKRDTVDTLDAAG
nr:hypothetical protein BaRGS_034996 [Batillaria attramentaria]